MKLIIVLLVPMIVWSCGVPATTYYDSVNSQHDAGVDAAQDH
jgi:hypothetical protein